MGSPFLREELTLWTAAAAPEHLHSREVAQAGVGLALEAVIAHLSWVSERCAGAVLISRGWLRNLRSFGVSRCPGPVLMCGKVSQAGRTCSV